MGKLIGILVVLAVIAGAAYYFMNNNETGDPAKKADFEQSLARLEEVVRKLESANLPLDQAMKLFEEGMQLSATCRKQLEEAEGKVEILLKQNGKVQAEPFESPAEKALRKS